jgi:8-oxo-dGTP diphosphatase
MSFIYEAEVDYFEPPICNEGILEWHDFNNMIPSLLPKTDFLFINTY